MHQETTIKKIMTTKTKKSIFRLYGIPQFPIVVSFLLKFLSNAGAGVWLLPLPDTPSYNHSHTVQALIFVKNSTQNILVMKLLSLTAK